MKFYQTVLIIIATVSLTNCSKSGGGGSYTPPTTSMELTFTDDASGGVMSTAQVLLFTNANDQQNLTNSVQSGTTDAAGKIKFTGLSPIRYYWYAQLGCRKSLFQGNSTASAITSGVNNILNAKIGGVGQLGFINTSPNPYRIFVNGVILINSMPGNSTQSTYFPSSATAYNIRVLQLSGYVFTPTDITYTGTLTCGGTLTTTFP